MEMSIQKFIEDNNIAILVKADLNTNEFEITQGKTGIESRDLFEQLILGGNAEDLRNSVKDQIMPRIWAQGNSKCFLCKSDEDTLIALFLDTELETKDLYYYAKQLDSSLKQIL